MSKKQTNRNMANCLNCGTAIIDKSNFCSLCGQKTKTRSLSFWNLVTDFLSNFFNLETKIWRTLRDIWIPAKLTREYVQGKRMSYYNPIRIFIVALVSFFTLLLFMINDGLSDMNKIPVELQKLAWEEDKVIVFDSLAALSTLPEDSLVSLRKNLFNKKANLTDSIINVSLNDVGKEAFYEIERNNPQHNIYKKLAIIDSLGKNGMSISKIDTTDEKSFSLSFDSDDIEVSDLFTHDLIKMSAEELKASYGKGVWWKEVGIVQLQKIFKEPISSTKFLIGNGTWAIVAVILLLGFFFKLLYLTNKRLYAEHTVFHLYGHTRIMLMAVIGMLMSLIVGGGVMVIPIVHTAGMIYLFLGMKAYYGQSFFKTFFKYSLTLIMYMLLLIVCSLAIMGISFWVF